MKNEMATREEFLDELYSKWMLSDIKSKIVQTICNLLDDQVYVKNDAIYSLLEVVELIDLEEKRVNSNEAKEKLAN